MQPLVNRIAVIVRPKQPYADWANSFDDDGVPYELGEQRPNCYLIDEIDDLADQTRVLRKYWKQIFEEELEGWMRFPEDWPEKRTYREFKQWFQVEIIEMVWDIGKKGLFTD